MLSRPFGDVVNKYFRLFLLSTVISASSLSIAGATEFVVKGNARIDASSIRAAMVTKNGSLDAEQSLKALFATGQFEDVKIYSKGATTYVTVVEAALLQDIIINGNTRLKDADLMAVIDVKPGDAFRRETLQAIVDNIQAKYVKIGRLDTKITANLRRNLNQVIVGLTIDEGAKTAVDTIYFDGNSSLGSAEIRSVMSTKEASLLNSLLNKDVYDLDQIDKDREMIRRLYVSKGFADVEVSDPDVTLDQDSHTVSIGFKISEGPRYKVGEVVVDNSIKDLETFKLKPGLRTGEVYRPDKADMVADKLASDAEKMLGSAVRVGARTTRLPNGSISVTYTVDKAANVYIDRIEIVGNDVTKDYVIRRELDFAEGDRIDIARVKAAERRLRALGLFSDVQIKTTQGDVRDRATMTVAVKEQKAGEYSVGAGYSNIDGIVAEAGISHGNFMGTGRSFGLKVGRGVDTTTYDFSFSEPYFMGYRATGNMNVYRREISQSTSSHPYDEAITGGRFGISLPINAVIGSSLFYEAYQRDISDVGSEYRGTGALGDPDLIQDGAKFTSALGYSLSYNSLDDLKLPSDGVVANFEQKWSGIGGDTAFVKSEAKASLFSELNEQHNVIASLTGRVGNITGLGQPVGFEDHLRNDTELVRGFQRGGIGPREMQTGFGIGGQYYLGGSAEASIPMPLLPETYGLRSTVFSDLGTVFNPDQAQVASSGARVEGDGLSFRASIGTGVAWDSPLGLIRANVAVPLMKEDYDKTQWFSFSAGRRF